MNLEMYLLRILAKNVHGMILKRTLQRSIGIHTAPTRRPYSQPIIHNRYKLTFSATVLSVQ